MTAYRATPPVEIKCPRCKKQTLPALDVAACPKGCGTWVSMFAASVALAEVDRRSDPVTRWWRVREPCPHCSEKMILHGAEPGLLQGCPAHGFFIDADTIQHTKLAGGVDEAALQQKRENPEVVEAELERVHRLEQEASLQRAEKERISRESERFVRELAREREHKRRFEELHEIVRGVRSGNAEGLAKVILQLVDRVVELERRLDQLERQPKA